MHRPPSRVPSFGRLVEDHGAFAAPLTDDELKEFMPYEAPNPDYEYIAIKSYYSYDPEKRERKPNMRPPRPELIITWDKANNEIRAITSVGFNAGNYHDLILQRLDKPRDLEHLYELLAPSVDARNNQAGLA